MPKWVHLTHTNNIFLLFLQTDLQWSTCSEKTWLWIFPCWDYLTILAGKYTTYTFAPIMPSIASVKHRSDRCYMLHTCEKKQKTSGTSYDMAEQSEEQVIAGSSDSDHSWWSDFVLFYSPTSAEMPLSKALETQPLATLLSQQLNSHLHSDSSRLILWNFRRSWPHRWELLGYPWTNPPTPLPD